MDSVGYNTFTVPSATVPSATDTCININSIDHPCLICLEKSQVKDEVTLINDMHFLIKECNCICYSHHNCIKTWIENKSVCPICRKVISFPKTGIKNWDEVILMSDTSTENAVQHGGRIVAISNNYATSPSCLRNMILTCIIIFVIMMTIQIIF